MPANAALDIWPDEAIEAMHLASLALLERAGVKVESPAARELFLAAGCTLSAADRVLVPRAVVDDAVAACPASYSLAARDPEKSLVLDAEPGVTYVHNMGGARDVIDPRSGAGTARAAERPGPRLPRDAQPGQPEPGDLARGSPKTCPTCSSRCTRTSCSRTRPTRPSAVPGSRTRSRRATCRRWPWSSPGADGSNGVYPVDLAFSPVSPLVLGGEVTDALVAQVRRGGAIVEILPCPAAATTAPGALSAAIAQQNAEVLAGVVLTQLAAPGTPVYYGPRLSAVDPRSGVVVSGTPETGVASVAAVLLARRYGLACDCYGPCSDSKVVDAQFGYERAVNALLGIAARPRLLSGIGEIQAGVSSCLEVLVIDDEVLNNVFYAVAGRPWDADALDVEAMVDGVLSGRGFLGTKHTRRYIRSEFVAPLLSYRGGLNEWLAAGRQRRRGPGRREGRRARGARAGGAARRPARGAVRPYRELRRRDRGARVPRSSPRARDVD